VPLPWVPRASESSLAPPPVASSAPPLVAQPVVGRRRRHPAQRLVSGLLVVAVGLMIGSAAAVLGPRLNPVHPTNQVRATPPNPSPSATPTNAAQLLGAVAAADLPEIVTVVAVGSASEELGTGWPIDATGDFITNDHVVHGGESLHVLLASGEQYGAEVINDDPGLDLAEVHVFGLRENPLPLYNALPLMGAPVVVLAARGATGEDPVTTSTVDGLDQSATVENAGPGELSSYTGLIRISAKIYPGNSGGPMLTPLGQVVGILTLAAQSGQGAFAIPIAQVDEVIQTWLNG